MPTKYTEHLPLDILDIVPTGISGGLGKFNIRVESSTVKFTDTGPISGSSNAWCYVREGAREEYVAVKSTYLGPVINVQRGEALKVTWINTLHSMPSMNPEEARIQALPPVSLHDMTDLEQIDQFKSMNSSIGIVTHLHGGKVQPDSDGWPLLPASYENNSFKFKTHRTYVYPNDQRAAMLWFHDHGMDNTAQQVYAGLAGLYFVRDESDADLFQLIGDESQEIPLVIQDRRFNADFTQADYQSGVPLAADKTKFDRPEFLGDTIMVNGRPWPHAHVHPMVYRLRVLNGSNARTYALALVDPEATTGKVWYGDHITAIGNDAGLFSTHEKLPNEQDYLLLAPGERLDLLLDLTDVDTTTVKALRLINLAVKNAAEPIEPIFRTDFDSVVSPLPNIYKGSLLADEPKAQILQFKINPAEHGMRMQPLDLQALDAILARHADDESFHWNSISKQLVKAQRNAPIRKNRFILLMNNTEDKKGKSPHTDGPWRDTQIWELISPTGASDAPPAFELPFEAHLNSTSLSGAPSNIAIPYQVARSFFFEPEEPQMPHARRDSDPLWGLVTENLAVPGEPAVYKYPHLYRERYDKGRQVIKPKEGSYERWYVANIGNNQPASADSLPDMHPFHMHLVNFVVTKRFVLQKDPNDPSKSIFVAQSRSLDFDEKVRHDTVRIQANELVELLVHFPKGYTGSYPYHCHLVEHEDMGMMLHFDVQPKT